MIKGMSYPKGVFFMDKEHIAHATVDSQGEIRTIVFPFDVAGILFYLKRTLLTIPWYFALGMGLLTCWVWSQADPPFYFLLLAVFGYHFIFPYPLKQYHGAEHKVFSYQGKKTLQALDDIRRCDIVNRNCSTNSVVIFYVLFLAGYVPLGGNLAALLGLMGVWIIPRWLKGLDRRVFFPLSAFIQEKITTTHPDEKHLKVALLSYISLTRKMSVNEHQLREEFRIEEEKKRERLFREERERKIEETEWLEI